jgi:tetratricopeptide (TPR) repeat protein
MNQLNQELARGWQIHQRRQLKEAEVIYREVLRQDPTNANAWCYLGIVLHDQREYAGAAEAYRRAVQLQPQFPIALNNLGNSLRYLGEYEQADQCFQQAIQLKPDYLNAFKNRGTLHVWTGNLDLGLRCYEQALQINPNEAELHRNLGVIYLLQGKFEQGWREYRWRWRVGDLHRPQVAAPVWEGSDLAGKSILLSAEQGLGDTLHFVRFASLLRQRGADTTVYCQPPLMALLQGCPELGKAYPNSLALDHRVDFQCSLLDVADVLGVNAETIPAAVPYLRPAPHLRDYWRARFPNPTGAFRVGIAWQGNPDHQADAFRSFPLACFERLAELPGVELVSLQSGHGAQQIDQWRGKRPITIVDPNLDKSSGAFMDTAAILQSLDLVVSSDTAVAHLAGALAVPTWIALGFVPDWRWMLDRPDSPWYPTVRLFRQQKIGDWLGVFAQIRSALSELLRKESRLRED